MTKLIDRIIDKLIIILSNYKDRRKVAEYIEGIRDSYEKLSYKSELTKEQKSEIQEFYKSILGYEIPLDWHRYFVARTGHYSKYYIPTSEYKSNIVGRLNIFPLKRAYTDKNVTDLLLPDIHQPRIILKNMNGYFYADNKPLSRDEALLLCSEIGDVVIKPSLTGRGQGVKRVCIKGGVVQQDGSTLEELFNKYKSDFLIEELILQHPDMNALNPSSVNTIRIVTYRCDMEIRILYTVIRIGRKDQPIDNESAGGISTVINSDGTLGKYAYGAPGNDRIEYTDSGVKLEGYKIPSYHKSVELAKKAHMQLPYFNLMGWDFSIEKDGTPVLIEFNMTPDLSQSANGPAFGKDTETILKEAIKHRNTWSMVTVDNIWKKTTLLY